MTSAGFRLVVTVFVITTIAFAFNKIAEERISPKENRPSDVLSSNIVR